MWLRLDCDHFGPGERHLTLFSYATSPPGEVFWVGYQCRKDYSGKYYVLVKMPNEPWVSPTANVHDDFRDPGGGFADKTWHHLALSGRMETDGVEFFDRLALFRDGVELYNPPWKIPHAPGGYTPGWETPPPSPENGGSVILGQGQSNYNTLHHDFKHHHGLGFEYLSEMTEVRLWNYERVEAEIFATYNKRLRGLRLGFKLCIKPLRFNLKSPRRS